MPTLAHCSTINYYVDFRRYLVNKGGMYAEENFSLILDCIHRIPEGIRSNNFPFSMKGFCSLKGTVA
jgi:hypothetical protein